MGKIALRDSFSHRLPLRGCCENIVAFARRSPINRFDGFSSRVNSLENLDKAGAVSSNAFADKIQQKIMNKKYDILVAEPWDFESPDGQNIIKGEIINMVSQSCIIYKTNHNLKFGNIENDILVLSPRHREFNFDDLSNEKLALNCQLLMPNIELTENESLLKSNSNFVIIGSFKK